MSRINKKIIKAVVLLEAMGMIVGIYDYVDRQYWSGGELIRNDTGDGDYEENIRVRIEGISDDQEMLVTVKEKEYSAKEAKAILAEGEKEIESCFLGENSSLQKVTKRVCFKESAAEQKIKITWVVDQPNIVDVDGSIQYKNLDQEEILVNATATLKLGDYESVKQISFMVCRPDEASREAIMARLAEAVEAAQEKSITKTKLMLPDHVGEHAIRWIKTSQHTGVQLMVLGILAGLVMCLAEHQERKRKEEKYNEELLLDYPQIISSLSLLISAGVSTKGAWQRIAGQYLAHRNNRPGYEQVLRTYYEMEDGLSERQAYENLGKRVAVREYRKLSMMLLQNMTKGMQQLKEQFEKEEEIARENRMNRARRLGEEASTKLLVPMMMLLGIVLMILVVPAMMQMSI